jgi:hypothetical protein
MAIKLTSPKPFLGAQITNTKVLSSKIDEIITEVNNLTDGSISSTDLSLSGTLAVTGVSTLTGGIVAGKGDVTQIGFITTGVATGAKPAGVITTVSSTLAAGTNAAFIVTNGLVTATSVIMLTADDSATAGLAKLNVQTVGAGVFSVNVTNIHGTNAFNNVIKIHYLIV